MIYRCEYCGEQSKSRFCPPCAAEIELRAAAWEYEQGLRAQTQDLAAEEYMAGLEAEGDRFHAQYDC